MGDRRLRGGLRRGLNPLWAKAPVVLFRYPGLLAALAVGALLLSLGVTAYPLFVSASSSALLHSEISDPLITRYGAGMQFTSSFVPLDEPAPPANEAGPLLHEVRGELFAQRAAESPLLGETVASIHGPTVSVAPADHPNRAREGSLFAGTGAVQHIEVVEGEDGSGAWLPDIVADGIHVGPGDVVRLEYQNGGSVEVEVDGVYSALSGQPRRGYWLQWDQQIYPSAACPGGGGSCPPPPPFILLDRSQLLELAEEMAVPSMTFGWQAPLRPGLRPTLDETRALQGFYDRFRGEMSDPSTYVGEVFRCCHERGGIRSLYLAETEFSSRVHLVLAIVRERIAALRGPGQVLQTAGILVAVAVLASAGIFGLAARSTEKRLLFARGTGPSAVGARWAVESLIACVAGAAAGLGMAILLVTLIGPEGPLSSSATRGAVLTAALAAAAAAVTVGAATALGSAGQAGHRRSGLGVLARIPWEVALLGLALFLWRRLEAGQGAVVDPVLGIRSPSPALLLFPIAFLGGFALLGARVFRAAAHRERRGGRIWTYLTAHRLTGPTNLTLPLFAAAGLCLGVFVQSLTLVRSLESSVNTKADVFVGSDVGVWVQPETVLPDDLPVPATRATVLREAGVVSPDERFFDLLAVDPDTLASAALWNPGFSDVPLEELMARLKGGAREAAPVIVAGPGLPVATSLEVNQGSVPVEVVGRTTAFPRMVLRRPLVVIDEEALVGHYPEGASPIFDPDARTEIWIRGDTGRALEVLSTLGIPSYQVVSAAQVRDIPYIAAVIDTFVVLNALGLATALLVVAAMVMYLQARERSQIVAYGLSLRMGMRPANHRRSLLLEVGSILGSSYVVAVSLAFVAAFLLIRLLDPLATIPPEPTLAVPIAAVAVVLGGLVVVAWIGAWVAHRRANTAHLGEVMRLAE
ncbi:MAG: hypothetical protein ACRDH8_08565 [Actinomycetota bacterium]